MSSMSSCIWQIALGAYRFCWLVRDTKHKKIGSLQNKGFTNVLFRLQNKSVLVIFNRTWNLLSVLSLCNLNPLKRKKKPHSRQSFIAIFDLIGILTSSSWLKAYKPRTPYFAKSFGGHSRHFKSKAHFLLCNDFYFRVIFLT